MNTTLIGHKSAVHPVRFALPSAVAAWLQCFGAAWTDQARAATGLRDIATGNTVWVKRPRGCLVSCQIGTLWLTFDGEPEDIVLEAGDSHFCSKNSALSIHALSAAVVRIA